MVEFLYLLPITQGRLYPPKTATTEHARAVQSPSCAQMFARCRVIEWYLDQKMNPKDLLCRDQRPSRHWKEMDYGTSHQFSTHYFTKLQHPKLCPFVLASTQGKPNIFDKFQVEFWLVQKLWNQNQFNEAKVFCSNAWSKKAWKTCVSWANRGWETRARRQMHDFVRIGRNCTKRCNATCRGNYLEDHPIL